MTTNSACRLRPRCTTGPVRKVTRDVDEDVRDHVRALAGTEGFERSARERKKVEMAFAHLKRILKLDRLRLRGLTGAKFEVLLAATAQNLRKLANYAGRAPPHSTLPRIAFSNLKRWQKCLNPPLLTGARQQGLALLQTPALQNQPVYFATQSSG